MKCPECGAACELVAACSDRENCMAVYDVHNVIAAWRAVPPTLRRSLRQRLGESAASAAALGCNEPALEALLQIIDAMELAPA